MSMVKVLALLMGEGHTAGDILRQLNRLQPDNLVGDLTYGQFLGLRAQLQHPTDHLPYPTSS